MSTELYSQNLPIAMANVTKKGITYSYGETDTSVAISLAYKEGLNSTTVHKTIISIFPNMDDNRCFVENSNIYFFIHELKDSTKVELRLKETHNSSEEFNDLRTKTKNLFKSILEL